MSSRSGIGYAVAGFMVVAVVAAVLLIGFLGGGDGRGDESRAAARANGWPAGSIPKQRVTDLNKAVAAAGCRLRRLRSEGQGHTLGHVDYKSKPPTSGPHYPVPAHDAAFLHSPGDETLVHALEHGRVIYWWRPPAPARVRGALKKLYDEDSRLVVLTPVDRGMPYQVAATAWTRLLGCKTYNARVPDAFRAFRDAYRLHGPEYIPTPE